MRIAFPRLLRIQLCSNRFAASQRCTHTSRHPHLRHLHRCIISHRQYATATVTTQPHDHDPTDASLHSQQDRDAKRLDKIQDKRGGGGGHSRASTVTGVRAVILKLTHEQRQEPDTWVRLLEKYIPRKLRSDNLNEEEILTKDTDSIVQEIMLVLNIGRKASCAGTDILAYMITTSRRKAGLWLCDFLLKNLVASFPQDPADALPSNIEWPKYFLKRMTNKPIQVDSVSVPRYEKSDHWHEVVQDPRYTSVYSAKTDRTMDQIWSTLGSIVVQAANMPQDESEKAMNAVQLVLGLIHNLDLVPGDVYAYQTSPLSIAVQRPPILHLLSSRILTSLSDAAWRVQQDENIEKAASHGLSYKQIGRDPPGGRFRLKVRPLSPEVWLEFILWCCVEGGFASAAARTIKLLRDDTKDPWFAVTWSGNAGKGYAKQHIDWDRVKSRTGGTVGRIEGYSQSEPLAEVPSRTISTEVVLATIEAHIDMIQRTESSRGIAIEGVQDAIVSLFSFLEPHDLQPSFFDYVSVRLLQTEAFETRRLSKHLRRWYDRLTLLRTLATVRPVPAPQMSFQVDAVLGQSEFSAGLLHQVLHVFVQDADVHNAIAAFDNLQKLVDNSKLHAISSFLQHTHFSYQEVSPKLFGRSLDFVDSHGQLPLYRLAALLDLATDTNLVGFGQWLVYNLDPDGPAIPTTVFANTAMAKSLVRFAGVSHDLQLLKVANLATQTLERLPSVSFLRTNLDARIRLLDFDQAERFLDPLRQSRAGGFGLSNLAHLASATLKLEDEIGHGDGVSSHQKLEDAVDLLRLMLTSQFDGMGGVFRRSQRRTFVQQVSHLLLMFKSFPESRIAALAMEYQSRFRSSNVPDLSPSLFNVFLEGVVKSHGATSGMHFVDKFCTHEVADFRSLTTLSNDFDPSEEVDDDFDFDPILQISSSVGKVAKFAKSQNMQAFIPFVSDYPIEQTNHKSSQAIAIEQTFIPFWSSHPVGEASPESPRTVDEQTFVPFTSNQPMNEASTNDSEAVDEHKYISFASNHFVNRASTSKPEAVDEQTFVPFASSHSVNEASTNNSEAADEQTFAPFVSNHTVDEASTSKPEVVATEQANPQESETVSDERPSHVTEKETEFVSPFFSLKQSSSTEDTNDKVSDLDATNDDLGPVCVPDTRTIRLVIRKAMQEIIELTAIKGPVHEQKAVLAWARRRLVQHGCDANMIFNEMQEYATEGMLSSFSESVTGSQTGGESRKNRETTQTKISRVFSGTPTLGIRRVLSDIG